MEVEVQKKLGESKLPNFKKISKTEILDLLTGEVIEIQKAQNKLDTLNSVRCNMARARYKCLHNAVKGLNNCYFVTLTYEDNMQDFRIFNKDCKNFLRNLRRHNNKFDYFLFKHKQIRGSLHAHLIIWSKEKLEFDNDVISDEWSNKGLTKCSKLKDEKDLKNVVFYLTNYNPRSNNEKVLSHIEALKEIPVNENLISSSRGLEEPVPVEITEDELKKYQTTNTSIRTYGLKHKMLIAV